VIVGATGTNGKNVILHDVRENRPRNCERLVHRVVHSLFAHKTMRILPAGVRAASLGITGGLPRNDWASETQGFPERASRTADRSATTQHAIAARKRLFAGRSGISLSRRWQCRGRVVGGKSLLMRSTHAILE